jgi:glycosyltransferase involved in cell wall biosynthesis
LEELLSSFRGGTAWQMRLLSSTFAPDYSPRLVINTRPPRPDSGGVAQTLYRIFQLERATGHPVAGLFRDGADFSDVYRVDASGEFSLVDAIPPLTARAANREAKSVLWPALHEENGEPSTREGRDALRAVADIFAKNVPPGSELLVNDFDNFETLRRLKGSRFQMHIPIPRPEDVPAHLREALAEQLHALTSASTACVHVEPYRVNALAWVNGSGAAELDPARITVNPVGVDIPEWQRLARRSRYHLKSRRLQARPVLQRLTHWPRYGADLRLIKVKVIARADDPAKNLERAVRAFARAREMDDLVAARAVLDIRGDATRVAAGNLYEKTYNGYRAALADLPPGAFVETPRLDDVPMAGYLRDADVLWAPSTKDGLNLTVFDATAAAKRRRAPVIAVSEGAGACLVAGTENCVTFDPFDTGSMARGLIKAVHLVGTPEARMRHERTLARTPTTMGWWDQLWS